MSTSSYTYDSDLNLTDLGYSSMTTGTAPAYHWDYNADGQVTDEFSRADTSGTLTTSEYVTPSDWAETQYGYDNDGELTGVNYSGNFAQAPTTSTSQWFDPNGNRAGSGATSEASATNELLFDGTYYYQYDTDGNRTARYKNSHDPSLDSNATDITTYSWNSSSELVGISYQANAGDSPAVLASFAYDTFGKVVAETENGTSESLVYDGQNVLLALNVDGQVVERELNGPAVDQVLASETVTPVTSGHERPAR